MAVRGQRREFSKKEIEQIETLAGWGLPLYQISYILDVNRNLIRERMNENGGDNDIARAVERGKAAAAANVTQTAYKMAVSGKQPTMTMFWLKCRQNWSELGVPENNNDETYPEV